MNREIKFRGRCVITGNWAYGYYYPSNGRSIIRDGNNSETIVLPESVSQYTNQKDENGKEVYEGDIVKVGGLIEVVEIIDGILCSYSHKIYRKRNSVSVDDENDIKVSDSKYFEPYEIIGNIYQNPELLNGN